MLRASTSFVTSQFARMGLFGGLLFWLMQLAAVAGQSVTLTWVPSTDTNAVGYKIYYGGTSGVYTNTVNVGPAATVTISGLTEGAIYYFSATTVSASGAESSFSNEATYVIPVTDGTPTPTPAGAPTLDAIADVTISQNAGAQTVPLTGIGAGSVESASVTVSASTSDPALIPVLAINYDGSAATGTLSFAAATDAVGSATITVTVDNGGATNQLTVRAFTVTVTASGGTAVQTPITPPTLDAIADLIISQNAGVQSVPLTGISAGFGGTGSVTVTAWSSDTGVISAPIVYYTNADVGGTLVFAPVAGAVGTATVTVTMDNGGATNNTATRSFNITVVAVPTAPMPTVDAITNLTIYQNSGLQTVPLTGIASGITSGYNYVTIWAYTSDPTIIPAPTVNYTSPNGTGTLTFAPVANALGTATVTVKVNNGPNNVSQTFTVTVIPPPVVNQAPTLGSISNVVIYRNAGVQTVPLTGITSGVANENQILTVSASSSAPTIVPGPNVNYSSPNSAGTLTFAPVTNAVGTALVTVTVNDGGIYNNFATRTFSVTVVAPPTGNQPPTLSPIAGISLLQGTASQTVTVTGISPGTLAKNQTLKITAASSNPHLVPVPAIRYLSSSNMAILTLRPVATAVGTATITVTLNNGGKSNNIVSQSFAVTLVPNHPPTLDPVADTIVAKNSPKQTIVLTGITSGATNENQLLRVTAVSSNPRLVPAPTIQYVSPSTTGLLVFKPTANLTGSATITITVSDGARANSTFKLHFTLTVSSLATNPVGAAVVSQAMTESTPVAPPEDAAATLTPVAAAPGQIAFDVTGTVGGQYVIEATADLTHWTAVQTNTAPFTFQDDTKSGQRFYRAVYQQ